MLIEILWIIGCAACAILTPFVVSSIGRRPFGVCAGLAPVLAGFIVFPVLNLIVALAAAYGVLKDQGSD